MNVTIESISPDKARQYLARNTENRKLDKQVVARYAGAMRRGEWDANGVPIIFSDDDVLIDGQHRLAAAVQENFTLTVPVVHGIAKTARTTIDRGKGRTPGDVFTLMGEKNAHKLASACGVLFRYWDGVLKLEGGYFHPTTAQLLKVLSDHPQLRDSLNADKQIIGITPSLVVALHYLFGLDDEIGCELRDEFFNQLRIDFNGTRHSATQLLSQRMISNASSSIRRLKTSVMAALFIKAWKAFRDDKVIRVLKWNPQIEEFPMI